MSEAYYAAEVAKCCLCQRRVIYSSQPFVVDGSGRDAHLDCYEKARGFPAPEPEAVFLPSFDDL
jgi:hypothetical protein